MNDEYLIENQFNEIKLSNMFFLIYVRTIVLSLKHGFKSFCGRNEPKTCLKNLVGSLYGML